MRRDSSVQGDLLITAALSIWGLAIAIALLPWWGRPAPVDQLPGLATALNFDAAGPYRWMVGLMLLPLVIPMILRPISRRLSPIPWTVHTVLFASLATLWIATFAPDPVNAFFPCAVVIAICTLLRNRDLEFTRHDVVLVLVFMVGFIGLADSFRNISMQHLLPLTALLVFVLRIAVTFIASPLPPALSFVAAPLGIVLQTSFLGRDQRYLGWHAVAILVITPFILRPLLRDRRRAVAALALIVYPLVLYGYANAMSVRTADGKARVNFFENGHPLLPASEYLRGELPYRDVLPAHGLLEDGMFDYLVMQFGDVSVGTYAKGRLLIALAGVVALYALAFAAIGSAEGAAMTVVLVLMLSRLNPSLRLLPATVTLMFIAHAARRRAPRLFVPAGFGTVVCGLTSLDFAAYTFITLVAAVLRSGNERVRAARNAAIGIVAGLVPLFACLALLGIFDDFLLGTFVEIPSLAPVYVVGFLTPTPLLSQLRTFPEVLTAVLHRDVYPYILWALMAVFVGTMLVRQARRSLEPLVLLGVWTMACALSYAERQQLYFLWVFAIFLVYIVVILLRRRSILAVPALIFVVALAGPTSHLAALGMVRFHRGEGFPPAEWIEISGMPRARGALFHTSDAATVATVKKYVGLSLAPDETFLEMLNRPILHFLFNRDCPIREYEVPFYESEEKQREVIRRIQSNPRVKAVIVSAHPPEADPYTIDGIPNVQRAPLVWQYVQDHFTRDFEENGLAMYRRK